MVKNLVERTRARMESRKVEGEQGSLILDILIGMAIFALIAIIAVSAIGQYRERAYVQGATSDANAIGLALEAEFTDSFVYPDDATETLNGEAVETVLPDTTLSSGNYVAGYDVAADGESFKFCVEHRTGATSPTTGSANAWAVYDSAEGGLVDSGRGAGCASTEAAAALA